MIWKLVFDFLGGAVLGPVLNYFAKRSDNDTVKTIEFLKAQVETNNQRVRSVEAGGWVSKCIMALAGIPAALHFGLVFLDTVIPPFGSWGIPRVPAPYDFYQWAIISSFFVLAPVQTVASGLNRWLRK